MTTHTRFHADCLTDQCTAILRVMEVIDIAASGRIDMLIVARPDAGHLMVARAVHARGSWPNGPLVRVDCSKTLPASLEVDLFGLPAPEGDLGANFPGGPGLLTRNSRVYSASRGTLILEHLTAAPPAVQARILRLLERREAILVPEQQRVPIDIHLIAVEHPEVDLVRQGVCTELCDRISALRLDLPNLAIGPAEIPALAALLLDEICRRVKVQRKQLTSLAQILLGTLARRYSALELWLLLEELATRVPGSTIRVEDIAANVLLDAPPSLWTTTASLREAREQFERKYIAAVIERHHGRIPHAARSLGMERTNLYRKLRHLDVDSVTPRTAKRP